MSSQSKMNTTNDEIDLIELVKALWDKKIWIIISAFIFTAIAGVYAFTAKEKWTSNATVIGPRITELGNLLPIRAEYARIIGNTEFSSGGLAKSLHDNFRHFLLSDDLKKEFIEQSRWVKIQVEGKSEQEKRKFIADLITEYLQVHKPDNDKTELEEIGLKLSFSAETPEEAQNILMQYIDYVNNYVVKEFNNEFKVGLLITTFEFKF